MEASESGYFLSLKDKIKPKREDLLLGKIKSILDKHPGNDNYGVQRIQLALMQEGENTNYRTVYRIMKKHGILKKRKCYPNYNTLKDAKAQKSENLIKGDFTAYAPK